MIFYDEGQVYQLAKDFIPVDDFLENPAVDGAELHRVAAGPDAIRIGKVRLIARTAMWSLLKIRSTSRAKILVDPKTRKTEPLKRAKQEGLNGSSAGSPESSHLA